MSEERRKTSKRMAKARRRYEAPELIDLGELARGAGATCQAGSVVTGSCKHGANPTGTCQDGIGR